MDITRKGRVSVRDEKGVLMIEAAIALTFFMLAIMTVLSLINVACVQSKIGTALNETAKEMSEYSYLYALTGLNEKQKALYDSTETGRDMADETLDGLSDFSESMQKAGESGNAVSDSVASGDLNGLVDSWNKFQEDAAQAKQAGQTAGAQVEADFTEIMDNPKAFILGLGKVLLNEGANQAKTIMVSPLVSCMMKRHLTDKRGESRSFLKSMRVTNLSYSNSQIFADGQDEIVLVATYEVSAAPYITDRWKFKLSQTAVTRGWFGAAR